MLIRVKEDGSTQYPFNEKILRREHPNTSFPKRMTEEQLSSFGVYSVVVETPDELYTTVIDLETEEEVLELIIPEGQKLITSVPALVEDVWTVYRSLVPKLNQVLIAEFENNRKRTKDGIRKAYEVDSNAPVTDLNGVVWDGGFETAVKLDAALRLTESMGGTTVDFFDTYNTKHTLSFADALVVVHTVAYTFQQKLAVKQASMKAADNEINPHKE